jgi:DNA-binding CsgD family transcriptional regulator
MTGVARGLLDWAQPTRAPAALPSRQRAMRTPRPRTHTQHMVPWKSSPQPALALAREDAAPALHPVAAPLLAALVDALAAGVVVLDRGGRAIHINRRAAAILARADGIGLDRCGRLTALQPAAQQRLAALVGAIAGGSAACGVLRAPCRAPGPVLTVTVARPGGLAATARDDAAGLLALIHPSDDALAAPAAMLRAHLGLTAREAEIVRSLVAGTRLIGFAARAGISVNTVKFHLRAIYAKTGTHTQAGLVAKVSILAAGLSPAALAALACETATPSSAGPRPRPVLVARADAARAGPDRAPPAAKPPRRWARDASSSDRRDRAASGDRRA